MRFVGCRLRELFLHLETGSTGAAGFQHHRAKRTFVALAMMGKLPRFYRPQGNGKPRGFGESPLVVMEYL
jgi:hypothetical protein